MCSLFFVLNAICAPTLSFLLKGGASFQLVWGVCFDFGDENFSF